VHAQAALVGAEGGVNLGDDVRQGRQELGDRQGDATDWLTAAGRWHMMSGHLSDCLVSSWRRLGGPSRVTPYPTITATAAKVWIDPWKMLVAWFSAPPAGRLGLLRGPVLD
jgi:hypothetical protein